MCGRIHSLSLWNPEKALPIMKKAFDNGKKVRFIRWKLFIDGKAVPVEQLLLNLLTSEHNNGSTLCSLYLAINSLVFRRPVPKGAGANFVSSRKFLLLCFLVFALVLRLILWKLNLLVWFDNESFNCKPPTINISLLRAYKIYPRSVPPGSHRFIFPLFVLYPYTL